MKKRYLSLILIAVATFLIYAAIPDATEWELKKRSEEVTVYVRGYPGSPFRESKAVTMINTRLSALIAVLNDVDKYPQWVYRCEVAETLKEINHTERLIYLQLSAPWPVQGRDVVLRFSLSQDPETKTVTIKMDDVTGFLPEKNGLVRIPDLKGLWKLKPVSENIVETTYQIYVDPGGSVPARFSNLTAVQMPFNTVVDLRELVTQDKYQDASFEYIMEPKLLKIRSE